MVEKEAPSLPELYYRGRENLKIMGVKRWFPPDSIYEASALVNREYTDSLFFITKFLDPVEVDTSFSIFGRDLKAPIFCSPISKVQYMSGEELTEITRGVGNAGALMMLGIGGSEQLQSAIDTGTPVVKIVKPYQKTELIYEKVLDAESRGCVAVGIDIDHFYGALRGDRVKMTDLFGPQKTKELKQIITQTRLPFVIKGVLSIDDADKAVKLGASAIIVSNHGRGSIDFGLPSMIALPDIVEKVGQKLTVLIDTCFMTGNDVLKALALGAKAVGFASSVLIAHAADGAAGVELQINSIRAELHRTMAATGCSNLTTINNSIIRHIPWMM